MVAIDNVTSKLSDYQRHEKLTRDTALRRLMSCSIKKTHGTPSLFSFPNPGGSGKPKGKPTQSARPVVAGRALAGLVPKAGSNPVALGGAPRKSDKTQARFV